jgi:hypothetical protein
MNQKRSRPGVRQRNPAALNSDATAEHVPGRNQPVSFNLPIDDHYRLTADEHCWRIEQCRKDGQWRPVEYHANLEAAVNSLSGRLLRTSKVRTLADALAAVENVARTLTLALAPSYKVERRP